MGTDNFCHHHCNLLHKQSNFFCKRSVAKKKQMSIRIGWEQGRPSLVISTAAIRQNESCGFSMRTVTRSISGIFRQMRATLRHFSIRKKEEF